MTQPLDVIVIGGGLYGCLAATALAREGLRTTLLEASPGLLQQASALNQARVHNGYHYPRSIVTGARSHANYQRFVREFADSIVHHECYYAVAANGSRITARQFEQFCRVVRIPLQRAHPSDLVERAAVAGLWRVDECAFNADVLRVQIAAMLVDAHVDVRVSSEVHAIELADGGARVMVGDEEIASKVVLNCTYAGLEQISLCGTRLAPRLVYELAEIAIVKPPDAYDRLGLTVMDGPFFSCIPFPAGHHSLTHVRYTPHVAAEADAFPWHAMRNQPPSRFEEMRRAAARIAPWLADAQHVRSHFVVKVVARDRDRDDARPVLVHRATPDSPVISVLGSKLDNVYDFLLWLKTSLV